jgi:hypothetical protein
MPLWFANGFIQEITELVVAGAVGMPMNHLAPILFAVLATAACSPKSGSPSGAAPTPAVTSSTGHTHHAGLIKLGAIALLPDATFVPTPGYPGKGFKLGLFSDQTAFDQFAAAAGVSAFPAIDWSTQAVVYAVLDAQTNQLAFDGWSVDRSGTGTLQFRWIGIEPFYVDETPAVLAVVDRADLHAIDFTATEAAGDSVIGSVRVP